MKELEYAIETLKTILKNKDSFLRNANDNDNERRLSEIHSLEKAIRVLENQPKLDLKYILIHYTAFLKNKGLIIKEDINIGQLLIDFPLLNTIFELLPESPTKTE